VYGKLLDVLIQHWLVLTGLWQMPQRSLVKGCQMIKEQSARLAACMDDSVASHSRWCGLALRDCPSRPPSIVVTKLIPAAECRAGGG